MTSTSDRLDTCRPAMTAADILSALIRFDSVSSRSNLPVIDWIEAFLADRDVAATRIADASGEKANLVATIGPPDVPGYILSGHTDVVPVDGQDWTVDPFGGARIDDRVYGRGASDMKGFLACVLSRVDAMIRAGLTRPLHLVFSYDEEVGCIGVRGAIRALADWDVLPAGCFVGEPTDMEVVIAHKGKRSVRAEITGKTGHSSLAPHFVNAAEYGARLTAFISDIGRELAADGARDPLYDMPHSTAHVGVLQAGTQLNIVPERCVIDFEFRVIAADDADALVDRVVAFARTELEPAMQRIDPDTGIAFRDISEIPGLETDPSDDLIALTKQLAGRNAHAKVAYGTEGGLFTKLADIPTVVIGPGKIERAHKADEFVLVSELDRCCAFLDRLIAECRKPVR